MTMRVAIAVLPTLTPTCHRLKVFGFPILRRVISRWPTATQESYPMYNWQHPVLGGNCWLTIYWKYRTQNENA